MFAPDLGPYFVPTAAVAVENTHNFAGGAVVPLEQLQALRTWADEVGTRVHVDGARIWNAHVASGVPLATYGAAGRRDGRLPVQGARRAGRVAHGRLRRRDRGGPGAPQADGRRDAPGRRAGGGRAARPRPPPRAAGRRPRARPAAGRGVRRRPGRASTPTSSSSRSTTRPASSPARPRRACGWARSGRVPSGWSPTSTSTGPPSRRPPPPSPPCADRAVAGPPRALTGQLQVQLDVGHGPGHTRCPVQRRSLGTQVPGRRVSWAHNCPVSGLGDAGAGRPVRGRRRRAG